MLNNQQIRNNWPHIKSQVLKRWNKLSEAEVEKTHGDTGPLGKLIKSKYISMTDADFNKIYEKICNTTTQSSPRSFRVLNDIEDRDATLPSAEAGMYEVGSDEYYDDLLVSGASRRVNQSYARFDNIPDYDREMEDELSAYSTPRKSIDDKEIDEEYSRLDIDEEDENSEFITPDEIYPYQNPSASREDIPLGRLNSSATNLSSAKAALNSSAVSSIDAKKKL